MAIGTTGVPRARVVNVCFHGVGAPGRELEPDEGNYWVTRDRLEALLNVIVANPWVRITFDDGNASDLTIALPALLRRDLQAEVFVVAGRLGTPGSLDAAGVRQLAAAGMTIGTHGHSHIPWRKLDSATAEREFETAARTLEDVAGRPVKIAACPFGAYDRSTLTRLKRLGYERVYTVDEGSARTGEWLQSRYTILATDTPERLQKLIAKPDGRPFRHASRALKSVVKSWR